jgi:uncharacterized protein (TIGR00251 family)
MNFECALSSTKNGVLMNIEVTQGTHFLGISGYSKWRKSIQIKLTEYARRGRANEQLLRYLSGVFKKSIRDVKLVSGVTSSKKLILLKNIDIEEVKAALAKIII